DRHELVAGGDVALELLRSALGFPAGAYLRGDVGREEDDAGNLSLAIAFRAVHEIEENFLLAPVVPFQDDRSLARSEGFPLAVNFLQNFEEALAPELGQRVPGGQAENLAAFAEQLVVVFVREDKNEIGA